MTAVSVGCACGTPSTGILRCMDQSAARLTMCTPSVCTGIRVLDPDYLPYALKMCGKVTPQDVNEWLSRRRIPRDREGIDLLPPKASALLGGGNMASLTDPYWISYGDERWEDVNFFTNDYVDVIGISTFTPWRADELLESPGLHDVGVTTGGFMRKAWIRGTDGVSRLYKARSQACAADPISEVIASRLIERTGLVRAVHYDLGVYGLRLCSVCESFVEEGIESVPASAVCRERPPGRTMYSLLVEQGIFRAEDLDRMIFCDYLIGNSEDRHLGNIVMLYDTRAGQFTGMAPMFDMGAAFSEHHDQRKRLKGTKVFGSEEGRVVSKYASEEICQILGDTGWIDQILERYPYYDEKARKRILAAISDRRDRIRNELTYHR